MLADVGVGLVHGRGEALQGLDVSFVMQLVLGTCACYEVVQGLHLGGHVFHLGIYDSDGFFVDGFGCVLDRGVVFVYRLEK